jgi:hypothetical protein
MALYAEHDNLTTKRAMRRNGLPSHLVHHQREDEIGTLPLPVNKREKSTISSHQLFIRLGTFGVHANLDTLVELPDGLS